MKFFFPDSGDVIDPFFNFETEKHLDSRIPKRDDIYIHEAFSKPPVDGYLISKSTVDGTNTKSAKFSLAQRQRLFRRGVREYFRLKSNDLEVIGDCGAFAYAREEEIPYTAKEVVQFYEILGVSYGISPDHIIFEFFPETLFPNSVPEALKNRRELTIQYAEDFLNIHSRLNATFQPLAVAHGWDTKSYCQSVSDLEKIGYRYIALGGMVPLKTNEILSILKNVNKVRSKETKFHVLGASRLEIYKEMEEFGVASFDSTSPLMQAFKSRTDNYWTFEQPFTAIRIPQVHANPKIIRLIGSGEISQSEAQYLEVSSLSALSKYAKREISIKEVMKPIREMSALFGIKSKQIERYEETLFHRPWEKCECEICRSDGYQVIVFRGSERNRRRGFHNLWTMKQKIQNFELG